MNPYAFEKVSKEVRNGIANIASSLAYNRDQVFYRTLEMNYGEEAGYLYGVIGGSYSNCGRVDEIGSAQDFRGYNVKAACEQTGSYYENRDFGWFKGAFASSTTTLLQWIQKREVIQQTTGFAGASFYDNLQKHLEKVQERNLQVEELKDDYGSQQR